MAWHRSGAAAPRNDKRRLSLTVRGAFAFLGCELQGRPCYSRLLTSLVSDSMLALPTIL